MINDFLCQTPDGKIRLDEYAMNNAICCPLRLSLLDENGNKVFTLFHLLDTTSLDCRKAISSEISNYEDAIMVETAIRSGMDCIVTRNVKDSTKSFVKVREPSAFLKLLEAENETE